MMWRELNASDARELLALALRIEEFDHTPYRTSPEEVTAILTPSPRVNIVGAFCGSGILRCYALVRLTNVDGTEVYCSGGVDPAWRGKGLGNYCINWQRRMALARVARHREWRIVTNVDATKTDLIENLTRQGFERGTEFNELARSTSDLPAALPNRPFMRVTAWDLTYIEQVHSLWRAVVTGLGESAQYEQWVDEPAFFAPHCSFIALDVAGDRPRAAGFIRIFIPPQDIAALGRAEANIAEFVVAADYDYFEVGHQLVQHALTALNHAGIDVLSGGVSQSQAGTLQLFEELNFHVQSSIHQYVLQAR